jgi:hypothetical protein
MTDAKIRIYFQNFNFYFMLIKFSKPSTDKEREYWNRNGLIVGIFGVLILIFSAIEVLFSGSNITRYALSKLQHLPYGSEISGVFGFGIVAVLAAALWAVATVLFQNYFRNSDDNPDNDADATLNWVYIAMITIISGSMVTLGVNGAQYVGEEYVAYQPQTKTTEAIGTSRAEREASITAQAEKDIQRAEQNARAAIAAAKAKHAANAQAWRAKAKGSPANIAWANKQAAAHDAKAEAAAAGIIARNTAEIQHIQQIRDQKLNNTQSEYTKAATAIEVHNTTETTKSEASKADIGNMLKYISVCTVLMLLLMYWCNGRILTKSGMYLETPFNTAIHEGSLWSRFMMALGEYLGNHANNVAASIYEAAPERKKFMPNTVNTAENDPNTADTAGVFSELGNHSPTPSREVLEKIIQRMDAIEIAAKKNPERVIMKPFKPQSDASADFNPQMTASISPKKQPITLDVQTPENAEIQQIQPDFGVYTTNTPIGEGTKYTAESIAASEIDIVTDTDALLADAEYTPELNDLLNAYKVSRSKYNTYNNESRTKTETVKQNISQALVVMADVQNTVYNRGLLIKKENKKGFIFVQIQ